MKRRDFLKILGALVVAPGAIVAAIKAKPKQRVYAINYKGSGVTDAQLRDLIQATLKDLPQNFFEGTIFNPSIPYGIPYWCKLTSGKYDKYI